MHPEFIASSALIPISKHPQTPFVHSLVKREWRFTRVFLRILNFNACNWSNEDRSLFHRPRKQALATAFKDKRQKQFYDYCHKNGFFYHKRNKRVILTPSLLVEKRYGDMLLNRQRGVYFFIVYNFRSFF